VTAGRPRAAAGALLLVVAGVVAVILMRGGASPAPGRAAVTSAVPPSSSSATSSDTPDVVFLGDSWTVGEGATGGHGYAPIAAERLGWEYTLLGVSGSGYLQPGRAGPYIERVDAAAALGTDLIVVQGSLNDAGGDLGQLDQAAATTLGRLREAAGGDTAILVVGAPATPGTDREVIARINADIAEAADAAGLTFVDPTRENWTDPADPAIWADPVHPGDVGHERVADALVPLMRDALDR
jgi:lysophospholipase L1-like esterase